jgi:hypothetical protein
VSPKRISIRTVGKPRREIAPGTVRQLGDGDWEIRIERELLSANKTIWGHWRIKQRERDDWEEALVHAAADYAGVTTRAGLELVKRSLSLFVPERPRDAKGKLAPPAQRSRVELLRLVPTKRRLILDDVNLRFAGKHLVDGMKNIGMIAADSRKWLEEPEPTQDLSADGKFWTVIRLTRLPLTATAAQRDGTAVAGGLHV